MCSDSARASVLVGKNCVAHRWPSIAIDNHNNILSVSIFPHALQTQRFAIDCHIFRGIYRFFAAAARPEE